MVHGFFSIIVLIVSLLFLYISYFMIRTVEGRIKVPTTSVFFMMFYLLYCYFGAVYINIGFSQYEYNCGIYDRADLLLNTWYYSLSGLILIPLGMLFANVYLGYQPKRYMVNYTKSKLEINKFNTNYNFIAVIFLILVSIIVSLIYRDKIGGFPVEHILETNNLAKLRSDATNNFQGKIYRFNLFFRTLPLMLYIVVYFLKHLIRWRVLFLVLLLYNAFICISDFQKGPLINFFILNLLLFFHKKGKIDYEKILKVGLVVFICLVFMYVFFMGMEIERISDIFYTIFRRTILGQITDFIWWQRYQEINGYLWGASFPNPGGIFPIEHVRATVEIKKLAEPVLAQKGQVGSAPTVFWADWYLNFGVIGALFSMLFFGFMVRLVDILFISRLSNKKSIVGLSVYVFLINYFKMFSGTGFQGILFDVVLYFIPLLLFVLLFFKQILINFSRKGI